MSDISNKIMEERLDVGVSMIKELAKLLELNTQEYWQLIRFLRRSTKNLEICEKLKIYFRKNIILIEEETDFIDSLRPISIKRFNVDEDIAFFLAFDQPILLFTTTCDKVSEIF